MKQKYTGEGSSHAARDLLVYFAFCALPIATFLLMEYPDTQFYLSLLLVSLVVIVWFRVYHKNDSGQLLKYDANLDFSSIIGIAAATGGVLVVASLIVGSFMKSSLFVPMANMQLSMGQLVIPKFLSDVLFQLTLVAPSEECSKLVTQLSMFVWLKETIGSTWARVVSVSVPIMFWAVMHTYRNPAYMGQYLTVMVATAFAAGLIMYATMYYTKSLLATVLVHSFYNCIVLYMTYSMT